MRQYKIALAVALMLVVLLPAYAAPEYAGRDADHHSSKLKFSAQISFGDSLSDVGTYAVGTVAALDDVGVEVADGDGAGLLWRWHYGFQPSRIA